MSILCYGMQTPSCTMWDVFIQQGTEPWLPALGAQSLSYWTSREVPELKFLNIKWLRVPVGCAHSLKVYR